MPRTPTPLTIALSRLPLVTISPSKNKAVGSGTLAALAQGSDDYGNFELGTAPQEVMGDAEIAQWRRATGAKEQILYRETT